MNERRAIVARIARLRFSPEDDLTFAAALNEIADKVDTVAAETAAADARSLESFKLLERDYKDASANSVRK